MTTGWRLWVLLGAGLVLVALVAVVLPPLFVPNDVTGKEAADLANDVRGTFLQGLLGFAFLAAAVGTWRQVQIAERGQITERFKNAVDQLGNENPDVRLGGIYSIEQIAKDNPKTYHDLMIEILSAFVRRRSHAVEEDSEVQSEGPARFPADIQAALTVLGRRKPRPGELHVNLVEANLTRADLTGADLTGADLTRANLNGTNLAVADLSTANLTGADLSTASLFGADLTRANLTGVNLTGAKLTGAKLIEADLVGAHLIGADLTVANLNGASLFGANLIEAKLTHVQYDGKTMWPRDFDPPPSG